jgi:hypothetical protein
MVGKDDYDDKDGSHLAYLIVEVVQMTLLASPVRNRSGHHHHTLVMKASTSRKADDVP